MDTEISKNSRIKQLQCCELHNCFSFWDFENDIEKRKRIEREIENKSRRMYAFVLNEKYVAGMSLCPLENDTVYLSYLVVKEEYRNQGIGTEMINYACQLSKSSGFLYITLNVDDKNLNAVRLYERLGFIAVIGNDCGRTKMQKVL